jgi:hypothetical protein
MPQSDTAFIGSALPSTPLLTLPPRRLVFESTEGKPYFDEPYYVGFNVGGFELGITPEADAPKERPEAGIAYWESPTPRPRIAGSFSGRRTSRRWPTWAGTSRSARAV